jgi:hypothetical protein
MFIETLLGGTLILPCTILQAELVNQVEKHLINIMHGVSVSILFFHLPFTKF